MRFSVEARGELGRADLGVVGDRLQVRVRPLAHAGQARVDRVQLLRRGDLLAQDGAWVGAGEVQLDPVQVAVLVGPGVLHRLGGRVAGALGVLVGDAADLPDVCEGDQADAGALRAAGLDARPVPAAEREVDGPVGDALEVAEGEEHVRQANGGGPWGGGGTAPGKGGGGGLAAPGGWFFWGGGGGGAPLLSGGFV